MSVVVRLCFVVLILSACTIIPGEPPPIPPITPIAPPLGIRDIVTVRHIDPPWHDPSTITTPTICSDVNHRHEALFAEQVGQLTAYLTVQSCGWQMSEVIDITLTLPDGSVQQQQVESEEIFDANFATFRYKWKPEDGVGPFSVSFQGSSGMVAHTIHVAPPVGPHLYRLLDGNLWLYQFEPNEPVRLFQYELATRNRNGTEQQYQLVEWQTAVTDAAGEFYLETTTNLEQFPIYVAIGDGSGEVHIRSLREESRIIMP